MALPLALTHGQVHTVAPSNVRVTSSRVRSSQHAHAFTSSFIGRTSCLRMCNTMTSSNGSLGKGKCAARLRVTCWFKFGKRGMDAEGAGIYGSQARDDFDRDDVEQYFNYMGMLAVEGSYDKMETLLNENIHPVDILLLLAASEGDKPKIEELMRAGADSTVTDAEGRTALDRAADEETRNLIAKFPR